MEDMVRKGEFTLDRSNDVQALRADLEKARKIFERADNPELKDCLGRVLDSAGKMIEQMAQREKERK